jgi:hypothetical protein
MIYSIYLKQSNIFFELKKALRVCLKTVFNYDHETSEIGQKIILKKNQLKEISCLSTSIISETVYSNVNRLTPFSMFVL